MNVFLAVKKVWDLEPYDDYEANRNDYSSLYASTSVILIRNLLKNVVTNSSSASVFGCEIPYWIVVCILFYFVAIKRRARTFAKLLQK